MWLGTVVKLILIIQLELIWRRLLILFFKYKTFRRKNWVQKLVILAKFNLIKVKLYINLLKVKNLDSVFLPESFISYN